MRGFGKGGIKLRDEEHAGPGGDVSRLLSPFQLVCATTTLMRMRMLLVGGLTCPNNPENRSRFQISATTNAPPLFILYIANY